MEAQLKKKITLSLILVSIMSYSNFSEAAWTWSGCLTVTGVGNFIAYGQFMTIAATPAVVGCKITGKDGTFGAFINRNNVTETTANMFIAQATAALLKGKKIQIYYENSTSNCDIQIVSVGGYSGECVN